MWNVYETPWALLGAAVLVLLVVLTIRSVWPEKKRHWQWLLPLGIAALAFGLDRFVATDQEKINTLVKTGLRAAQEEDCTAIGRLISNDYEDSYHKSKEALLSRCRARLKPPAIEKIRKIASDIKITPPQAVATFTLSVQFEKNSYWAQAYKPSALVVLQFYLRKQSDGNWLVHRAEILEVDKMRAGWSVARMDTMSDTSTAKLATWPARP